LELKWVAFASESTSGNNNRRKKLKRYLWFTGRPVSYVVYGKDLKTKPIVEFSVG